MATPAAITASSPLVSPLGDRAMLVRFGNGLSEGANAAAVAFARCLERHPLPGVVEVVSGLVSVLLRYEPAPGAYERLAGEVRLSLAGVDLDAPPARRHDLKIAYGGSEGPDLEAAAAALGLGVDAFVAAHCARPLRVLATGFAPGFVYCGFHDAPMELPRRLTVRRSVPQGSVLFAARQTAIAATSIPTGWHVIGRTEFRNFDPVAQPPTLLRAGDEIAFEAVA